MTTSWKAPCRRNEKYTVKSGGNGQGPFPPFFADGLSQHRLELAAFQGGQGGFVDLGEIRLQGAGLSLRVILTEGHEVVVPPIEQGGDALCRA